MTDAKSANRLRHFVMVFDWRPPLEANHCVSGYEHMHMHISRHADSESVASRHVSAVLVGFRLSPKFKSLRAHSQTPTKGQLRPKSRFTGDSQTQVQTSSQITQEQHIVQQPNIGQFCNANFRHPPKCNPCNEPNCGHQRGNGHLEGQKRRFEDLLSDSEDG